MKHISQGDLDELRAMLEAERISLEEDLATHGRKAPGTGDWQGDSSGLEGEEADPTDAADQIEELITNVPLVEELEKQHKDIVDALRKEENGSYGTCEECGEAISIERLRANPAARTCMAHGE